MAEKTSTYYVWIVAAKDEFAEKLVSKLVRRGFTVGPLGRQLITANDDNLAVVVAMSLYRVPRTDAERKEYCVSGVYAEVVDVIKWIKGKFWGCVITEMAHATWNVGNISLKAEEEAKTAALKKVN